MLISPIYQCFKAKFMQKYEKSVQSKHINLLKYVNSCNLAQIFNPKGKIFSCKTPLFLRAGADRRGWWKACARF